MVTLIGASMIKYISVGAITDSDWWGGVIKDTDWWGVEELYRCGGDQRKWLVALKE